MLLETGKEYMFFNKYRQKWYKGILSKIDSEKNRYWVTVRITGVSFQEFWSDKVLSMADYECLNVCEPARRGTLDTNKYQQRVIKSLNMEILQLKTSAKDWEGLFRKETGLRDRDSKVFNEIINKMSGEITSLQLAYDNLLSESIFNPETSQNMHAVMAQTDQFLCVVETEDQARAALVHWQTVLPDNKLRTEKITLKIN